MSNEQLPEGFPPVIFPGQPIPAGLGRDDTPAEERGAQQAAAERAYDAAINAPDSRQPTETATGLHAAILGIKPGEKKVEPPKHPVEALLAEEEKNAPLSPEEVQALRTIIYQAHQRNKDKFDLPELPITDADLDAYFNTVLEHRPYSETFSLMRGRLKIKIREKYKSETDLIFAQIDEHFAQGRVRSEAGFATFLHNYSLLFQVVSINDAPLPKVVPVDPKPEGWTLASAAKNHLFEQMSDHTMFMLISLLTQFERKVRQMAQRTIANDFR